MKTSADDELSLLLAVGADTIGDIQVVPSGVQPTEVPVQVALRSSAISDLPTFSSTLASTPNGQRCPESRTRPAPAMINLPVARAGERYILKLNPIDYPHLVENEAFFLDAARAPASWSHRAN